MHVLIDACALADAPLGPWPVWWIRLARTASSIPGWSVTLACDEADEAALKCLLRPDDRIGLAPYGFRKARRAFNVSNEAFLAWDRGEEDAPGLRAVFQSAEPPPHPAPDIVVTMTLGRAARTAWPDARIVHHELHPFAREPFPNLWLLDADSVMPSIAPHRTLSRFDSAAPLAPEARNLIDRARASMRRTVQALASKIETQPARLPGETRPLLALPLPAPSGFRSFADRRPERYLDCVCDLIERCDGEVDILVTQHPLERTLNGEALDALRRRHPFLYSVSENATSCAPTNLLAGVADGLVNLSGKSVFLGLLFETAILECGVSQLGALSTPVDRLTREAFEAARAQALDPEIRARRDRVLYGLLSDYACTDDMLANPDFLRERIAGLAETPPRLSSAGWTSDAACARAYEDAAFDSVRFNTSPPVAPPDEEWSPIDLDALGLKAEAPPPVETVLALSGPGEIVNLPAELRRLTGIAFRFRIEQAPAHRYLPILVFGRTEESALTNRRLALYWDKAAEALWLSVSSISKGTVAGVSVEGSARIGATIDIKAVLFPEADTASLQIGDSAPVVFRIGGIALAEASHLGVGAALDWKSPAGAFRLSALRWTAAQPKES